MKIAVVALGKIGLPLAVQFACKGNVVIGCDINDRTVTAVNRGIEPFPGEELLAEKLSEVVNSGLLKATTDTSAAVRQADVVVVVVPLVVDKDGIPNFDAIDSATRDVGLGLKKNMLVAFETTLPVGTTRIRFAKMLERESGLRPGVDFSLVFSPERVFSGRVFSDLRRYPKIIGGFSESCANAGKEFYESVLDFDERADLERPNGVWNLGSCEAAEFVKLAETTYRDVNIGLANQFARFADKSGIDLFKVIEACNSQPFCHIHKPGIAVGGHCIPVYSQFYAWNDPTAQIVRDARLLNERMPEYGVQLLEAEHGSLEGQRVAVLGATYRGGVKDTSFSGVFPVVTALKEKKAIVFVHDPLLTDAELMSIGFQPYVYGKNLDAAIIQSDHAEYENLTAEKLGNARTLLNGRNMSLPRLSIKVVTLGNTRVGKTSSSRIFK